MQKEIKEIISYVKKEISPYLENKDLFLYEIIILPESSYYIIVRVNCNTKNLQEITNIENEFLPLIKKGIRVVIGPKGHKISDNCVIKRIDKKFKLYKDLKLKIKKKNPFNSEIEKIKEKIYKEKKIKDKILWEIEIKKDKVNLNFLNKESYLNAKKLIFLSEVAIKKRMGLISFLSK